MNGTTLNLKKFRNLKHSDDLLSLDWFGGISPNSDETDNPLIECFFTPTTPGTFQRAYIGQIRAGIAVGYLPSLFLGQFFRNGKHVPLSQWQQSETITFELDTSDLEAVKDATLHDANLADQSKLLASHFSDIRKRSGIKLLNGLLVKSDRESAARFILKNGPTPMSAIIHDMELIRFYFTNSPFSSKQIFNGAFQKEELFVRVFNRIHEHPWFDTSTKSGRFVYRHGYKQADAPILGRILFEPNGLALKAVQRVFKQITVDRINYSDGWLGFPRTDFPFNGKTRLKLKGRRLKTQDGFIFLACQMIGCSGPFPFKSLSYSDEICPGGAPPPQDAPVAFPGANTLVHGPANEDPQDQHGESVSDEPPLSNAIKITSELDYREFEGLRAVKLKHEKLRDSTHQSEFKNQEYDDSLVNASTGGGVSGNSSAVGQEFSTQQRPQSTVSPDLETFVKIINDLRKIRPTWKIKTICVGNGVEEEGEWFSFFPKVPCKQRKRMMRQFSFMDKDKFIRRKFLCVEINVDKRYLYIFEAQRRLRDTPPADEKSSPYKEDLPILLLRGIGYEEVLGDDFIEILKLTVKNETWPDGSDLTHFVKDYTVHGMGAQSVHAVVVRILELIDRNLL
ncbi:hypothetical protein RPD76_23945 [Methylomonas sp. MV1]|uniref:hypothetical protein n=1 Tax=Methylomonas sp. MV1 TaxID=3073620 RepID=UPI0028A35C1D|nr:hypothetical protein [Methylomonas sp. MV1]MDT4332975.1 hypothetical protein [Methylomonas sp. MV1]